MKYSIVMLCKNRKVLSEYSLRSVIKHTDLSQCQLIVVDAGSKDGLLNWLSKIEEIDMLISLPKERDVFDITKSPSYFQRGLQHAKGEYIVKMDGDIVVQPGWLEDLTSLVNIPNVGVSSYFFSNSNLSMLDMLKKNGLQANPGKFEDIEYVGTDIINGGIWVLKRSVFDALGGYVVDTEWGGALDSGFSDRVTKLGLLKIYGVHRKAVHLGAKFSCKNDAQNCCQQPEEAYEQYIMNCFPDIFEEFPRA